MQTDNPQTDTDTLGYLEKLARDEKTGAQARVSAARTILEVQGAIGRHQSRPDTADVTTEPSLLDRDQMSRELARLRARFNVA